MLASVLTAAALLTGLVPPPLPASEVAAEPSERPIATVAMADSAQVLLSLADHLELEEARATIIRPEGEDVPDIILVTKETTPEDLEQAIDMLVESRHSFGTSVDREMVAHVPAATRPSTSPNGLQHAESSLRQLQSGEEIELPGFGMVKSIFMNVREESMTGHVHEAH